MSDEVLYEFTVPYPWKRSLRGIYLIAFFVFLAAYPITVYWYLFQHSVSTRGFIFGSIFLVLLVLGLTLTMRYMLIKEDKIKEPIIIKVMTDTIIWKKGDREIKVPLKPVKELNFLVTDKRINVKANLAEYVPGLGPWWLIKFRLYKEINTKEDYKKFLNEICPDFKEVLTKQVKYLNPKVTIIEKDERRKLK